MAPKCKSSDAGNSDLPKRGSNSTIGYACIGKNIAYVGLGTSSSVRRPLGVMDLGTTFVTIYFFLILGDMYVVTYSFI